MKRIYAATVRMSDTDYIKDRLQTTIMNLNDCDIIERFLDTIFECDVKEYELPKVTIDYDGWTCTLNSFDYITDKVRYKREKDVIRYFKTQEDANTYNHSGKCSWSSYKYECSDEYQFKGQYHEVNNDYCSLKDWMERKTIEE